MNRFIASLKEIWVQNPLKLILFIYAVWMIFVSIFSKGFAFHDDHFLVIEASSSWVDGHDYNSWLPWNQKNPIPSGHSFFYVGIHFLIFKVFQFLGIEDPNIKMLIVRLLHSLFSMITIIYGFKITEKISNKNTAIWVALALSFYWFIPFLSVRNLVEIVCIPFLMVGVWITIIELEKEKGNWKRWLLAGLIAGLAINVRLQSVVFIAGLGLGILLSKKWLGTLAFGLGSILSVVIFQGGIDYFIWNRPFAEFQEYIHYNATHAKDYIVLGAETYVVLILGILIPPLSLALFYGFATQMKRHFLIAIPVLLFLLFHSIFPNKQERFILPIIPFVLILGITGWKNFIANSKFWNRQKKLHTSLLIFVIVLNLLVLFVFSFSYTKRGRVEAMLELSKLPNKEHYLTEDLEEPTAKMVPLFYLQSWSTPMMVNKSRGYFQNFKDLLQIDYKNYPRYALLYGENNIKQRQDSLVHYFKDISLINKIENGLVDDILQKLNKVNQNKPIFLYRLNHTDSIQAHLKSIYD